MGSVSLCYACQRKDEVMNRQDWLLLVLAAGKGKALSPIQLQKTLFLLKQTLPVNLTDEHFYRFFPYDYGPFASRIYQDAESLEKDGLVTIVPSSSGRWREYSIAPSGLHRAKVAESKLSDDVCAYIEFACGLGAILDVFSARQFRLRALPIIQRKQRLSGLKK